MLSISQHSIFGFCRFFRCRGYDVMVIFILFRRRKNLMDENVGISVLLCMSVCCIGVCSEEAAFVDEIK